MRQIKFRAWDKKEKKFEKYFQMDCNGMMAIFRNETAEWGKADDDRYILMQYTGLKDKNGKEICYGDIVKAQDGVWEIAYSEPWDGVAINLDNKETAEMSVDFADNIYALNEVEVIGNIYENPSLIK